MPKNLTPEYRRAYRARLIAEGRCAHCGRVRADDDRDTLCCHVCRASLAAAYVRRYADQREANPPAFARKNLRVSFRYGKTRLKNPRPVRVALDIETLDYIDRMRVFWKMSEDYEPYLVSEFVRRMLAILQNYDGPLPNIQGRLPVRESSGLKLKFQCDADNWAVIQRHCEETGCSIANAVRVCICAAGEILLNKMPDAEARRLIWPTRFDVIPGEKGKRIPPCPRPPDWNDNPEPDGFEDFGPDDRDLPLLKMPDGRPVRDVFPLRSLAKPPERPS